MFVLQNAWSSIKEHPWRTVGITLLAILVSGCTVTGMAITHASSTAQTTGYDALKPLVTMSLDREAVIKQTKAKTASDVDWSKYQISLTQFVQYATVANVQLTSAYYSETVAVNSIQDAKLPSGSKQITLTGFSEKAAIAESANGSITIVQGKSLTYDTNSAGQVLVPEQLATANGWKVGSTIKIVGKQGGTATEATIRGIYRNTHTVDQTKTGLDPATAIYGSYYELAQLGLASQTQEPTDIALTITVGTSNPSDAKTYMSSIQSQFKKAKLAHYQIVSPTLDQYKAQLVPLERAAKFTTIGVPVVIAVAAVLLIVILLLTWRHANEEIGLQMLLGRAKFATAWQYSLSVFPSVIAGWVIGGLACGFGTKPLLHALGIGSDINPTVQSISTTLWIGVLAMVLTLVLAWARTWVVTKSVVVSAAANTAVGTAVAQSDITSTDSTEENHE